MPENIKKKSGNPKRYDPVGPVQVRSPTREVVIPPVPEIVNIPKSSFAYAFHISEQPPIELFLDELLYACKGLNKDQKISRKVGIPLLFWIKDSMATSKDFRSRLSHSQICVCGARHQDLILSRDQK